MRFLFPLILLPLSLPTLAGPLTITKGGTYTGDWSSDDSSTPAVHVKTTDPVTIKNATIRSRGTLIEVDPGADLTVRNVTATGLIPTDADHYVGRFIDCRLFRRLIVEHCTVDHTSGIYLHQYGGDHSPTQTFKIRHNKSLNIDGRYGDGHGGYAAKEPYLVQFAQLNDVQNLANGEIAWNEIVNLPGQSAVEDNVNIFSSSGTPQSPLDIHDNYIQGAYPIDPKNASYSGGGIMLSDTGSAFVCAHDNQVVATSNYGIAISSGHDNCFHHNRILSCGKLPDGSPIPSQNVGAYVWNMEKKPDFARNTGHHNVIAWMKADARNDEWMPDAAPDGWKDNQSLDAVTAESEAGEYKAWQAKFKAAGMTVGAAEKH